MLTTYLLGSALFFAGFLAASLLRGKRGDDAAADLLLQNAAARLLADCRAATNEAPAWLVSQAAVDDLRQALAARGELRSG
ncbi:MAG: hypothetical protein C0483_20385 [Pirellula sp.]|nr:hypothetical protein [Pirellula sp.]